MLCGSSPSSPSKHAADCLGRLDSYRQIEGRRRLPWLLKVALTPFDERSQLFGARSKLGGGIRSLV